MCLTLIATLIMPVANAVLLGVAASFALELYRSADHIRLVQLVPQPRGTFDERPALARVPNESATLLMPYGTLSFAGARRFEAALPDPRGAVRAVVILAMRGRTELGSTFFQVLDRYARSIQTGGGRVMLTGVSATVREQLVRTGLLDRLGSENVFEEKPMLGAAAADALAAARGWLTASQRDDGAQKL